jgi:type I restriction enzyme, S subunit
MSKWKEYKLGDIADIISERVSIYKTTLNNYISTENMINDFGGVTKAEKLPIASSVNSFNQNDILFSNIRTYFKKVWLSKFNGTVSPDVLVFRAIENKCLSKYLYYSLCNPDFTEYSVLTSKGAKMPRGDKDALVKYSFQLPPLPEQTAIASVLSSLDNKIDLLHRQNTTLEKMAETLFRQWFVEEAKEDWEEIRLGSIVEIINGVSYKSDDLNSSKTAMVTLKSFDRNGGFRMDGFKEYTGKYKEQHILKEGDLVVAHTDITQEAEVIGNPVMVIGNPKYDILVFSMDLVKVISMDDNYSNEFLYLLMKSKEFKEHCLGYSNGSTVLHLSKKAIPEYEMKLPPNKLISDFSIKVKPLVQKQFRNQTQIRTLTALRDTLLPKLMSGEVRLSEL